MVTELLLSVYEVLLITLIGPLIIRLLLSWNHSIVGEGTPTVAQDIVQLCPAVQDLLVGCWTIIGRTIKK